ncbi:4-coumarate--CoA ligase 1 isoform X2 [Eurytemora carolleeae]|nr:4-coumarate--CoA ligase 1 isoform X2 [Eurytemora carolleeae]|eukprot:XP_023332842.1 4-coumarate--CoA ligase 1-like isoform X2 [Eurytemora affinis]
MSEFCAAAICPRPSASVDSMKKGSVGEVLPGLEVRVLDIENREPLGPNREGELAVRGGTVMKGYLGNPGATAATIDKDGWLLTGDLGMYDENENFYITGRLKELIKYKGWQIAPAELEDALITHEAVADCAVVGVEAEEDGDGEVPRAFIVVKPGYNPTPQDIQDFIKDNMASYKQLKGGVVFIETIPRSLAGKILRKELKKM